jgi:hypothetical protein
MPTPNSASEESGGTDRRRFLSAALVASAGVGAVWITPEILTVSAAAAASCANSGIIDWSGFTDGASPTSVTNAGVTVSLTKNDPSNQDPGNTNQGFQVSTIQASPLVKNYRIAMGGSGTVSAFVELLLVFSVPIHNLTFQLVDIDQGGFIDLASVVAKLGAGPDLGFTSSLPTGSTVTLGTGTNANPWVNSATGVNVPIGQSQGSINVSVVGPLDHLTIRQKRASTAAGGLGAQHIGVSNLKWCR